eukprot:12547926-Alexandrium_andersonii.AAC.1
MSDRPAPDLVPAPPTSIGTRPGGIVLALSSAHRSSKAHRRHGAVMFARGRRCRNHAPRGGSGGGALMLV